MLIVLLKDRVGAITAVAGACGQGNGCGEPFLMATRSADLAAFGLQPSPPIHPAELWRPDFFSGHAAGGRPRGRWVFIGASAALARVTLISLSGLWGTAANCCAGPGSLAGGNAVVRGVRPPNYLVDARRWERGPL